MSFMTAAGTMVKALHPEVRYVTRSVESTATEGKTLRNALNLLRGGVSEADRNAALVAHSEVMGALSHRAFPDAELPAQFTEAREVALGRIQGRGADGAKALRERAAAGAEANFVPLREQAANGHIPSQNQLNRLAGRNHRLPSSSPAFLSEELPVAMHGRTGGLPSVTSTTYQAVPPGTGARIQNAAQYGSARVKHPDPVFPETTLPGVTGIDRLMRYGQERGH
ncbi:MAG: hypothetical protein AB7P76_06315 [Candidatus Melainabacteria bacterium]